MPRRTDYLIRKNTSMQHASAERKIVFSNAKSFCSKVKTIKHQAGIIKNIPAFFSLCAAALLRRQLYVKTISLTLVFCLLFSSVAPSYGQVLDSARKQANQMWMTSSGKIQLDHSVENAIVRSMMKGMTYDPARESVKKTGAEEYGNAARLVETCERELYKTGGYEKHDFVNREVCIDGECYNALVYGQACVREALNLAWDGKSEVVNEVRRYGRDLVGNSLAISRLIGLVGAAEGSDTVKAFRYEENLVADKKACVRPDTYKNSNKDTMVTQEHYGTCEAVRRALEGLAVLGNMYPQYKTRAALAIYGFMDAKKREGSAAAAVYEGALLLMGLNTDYSYDLLEKFLVEGSKQTGAGASLERIGAVSITGVAETIQESKAQSLDKEDILRQYFTGKYFNVFTERYSYLDDQAAKQWGLGSVCQRLYNAYGDGYHDGEAIDDVKNDVQCPEGNLYEDLGAIIGADKDNERSEQLAKKIYEEAIKKHNWVRYPQPLVVGLLTGGKGEWTYKYAGQDGVKFLRELMKADYTDLNERSLRRLHKHAADALLAHGDKEAAAYFVADEMGPLPDPVHMASYYQRAAESYYKQADKAKFARYKRQMRIRSTLQWADIAWVSVLLGSMALALPGIVVKTGTTVKTVGLRIVKHIRKTSTVEQVKAVSAAKVPSVKISSNIQIRATGKGEAVATLRVNGERFKFGLQTEEAAKAARVGDFSSLKYQDVTREMSTEALSDQIAAVPSKARSKAAVNPTWRKGTVINRLGQKVTGYIPINPEPLGPEPSLWKAFRSWSIDKWSDFTFFGGRVLDGLGMAAKNPHGAALLLSSAGVTPVPALGAEAVFAAGQQTSKVISVAKAASPLQEVSTAARAGRAMSVLQTPAKAAARVMSPWRVAGSGFNAGLFLPLGVTPELERVLSMRGLFGDKQQTPGSGIIPPLQFIKDYMKAVARFEHNKAINDAVKNNPISGKKGLLAAVDSQTANVLLKNNTKHPDKKYVKALKNPYKYLRYVLPQQNLANPQANAIPVYVKGRLVSYWDSDEQTIQAMKSLKDNQSIFIQINPEKEKVEMYVRSYDNKERTKYTDTLVRSDIEITFDKDAKKPAVVATKFGWKKIAEGILLVNNRLLPLFGVYLMAGMNNVSSTIANFAKQDFTLSHKEMFALGGVSSLVMGLVSFVAGMLQQNWSRRKDGTLNGARGRNATMNIGMAAFTLAMILPMLAGMYGQLGDPIALKKYSLLASFFLLGIGAAFMDVSMKPVVLAASKGGDYQATQGYLSVFKQTVGNTGNYLLPPVAMAIMSLFGKAVDWTVFFPVYGALGLGIALLYNLFPVKQQTLELTETAPQKQTLLLKQLFDVTKGLWHGILKPFRKQTRYQLRKFFHVEQLKKQNPDNKVIRHGVAATALHGMNMSILGLYINHLFMNKIGGVFDMYAHAGSRDIFAAVWDSLSHSWLGHSLLFFTAPIILGRILGTSAMEKDHHIGKLTIPRMGMGALLMTSIVLTLGGIGAISVNYWPVQLGGIIATALGLTNISPIINGFTSDRNRHVSDSVSTLLSATAIFGFFGNVLFGWARDLTEASSMPWLPLLIPVASLLCIGFFGWEIAHNRFDKQHANTAKKFTAEQNKKARAEQNNKTHIDSKKLLGGAAVLLGGLGLSYLTGALAGLTGTTALLGAGMLLKKPSAKYLQEQQELQEAKNKLLESYKEWFQENEYYISEDATHNAINDARLSILNAEKPEDLQRAEKILQKLASLPLGRESDTVTNKVILYAQPGTPVTENNFYLKKEIRGIPSDLAPKAFPKTIRAFRSEHGWSIDKIGIDADTSELQVKNLFQYIRDIRSEKVGPTKIRMEKHELGITSKNAQRYFDGNLHAHFESTKPDEKGIFYNYTLGINMKKIAQKKRAQGGLRQLYTRYFGSFLSEEDINWPSDDYMSREDMWRVFSVAALALGWGLSQLTGLGAGLTGAGLLLGAAPLLPWRIVRENGKNAIEDLSHTKYVANVTRGAPRLMWNAANHYVQKIGTVKIGNREERDFVEQAAQTLQQENIAEKFPSLSVQFPVVIADGARGLPRTFKKQIEYEAWYLSKGIKTFKNKKYPFVLSPVDITGVSLSEVLEDSNWIQKFGGALPDWNEWTQIRDFCLHLRFAGIKQLDLLNNMFLSRLPNGKIGISFLDLEVLPNSSDIDILNAWEVAFKQAGAFAPNIYNAQKGVDNTHTVHWKAVQFPQRIEKEKPVELLPTPKYPVPGRGVGYKHLKKDWEGPQDYFEEIVGWFVRRMYSHKSFLNDGNLYSSIVPGLPQLIRFFTAPAVPANTSTAKKPGSFVLDPKTDTEQVILPKTAPLAGQTFSMLDALYDSETRSLLTRIKQIRFSKEILFLMNVRFALFRGISLNSLESLENLLRKGSEVSKSKYNRIFFASDLFRKNAFGNPLMYASSKDSQIPVLITLKSASGFQWMRANYFTSAHDIPAKKQDVFAFLRHDNTEGWYHVTLNKDGKIAAQPIEDYLVATAKKSIFSRIKDWFKERTAAYKAATNQGNIYSSLIPGVPQLIRFLTAPVEEENIGDDLSAQADPSGEANPVGLHENGYLVLYAELIAYQAIEKAVEAANAAFKKLPAQKQTLPEKQKLIQTKLMNSNVLSLLQLDDYLKQNLKRMDETDVLGRPITVPWSTAQDIWILSGLENSVYFTNFIDNQLRAQRLLERTERQNEANLLSQLIVGEDGFKPNAAGEIVFKDNYTLRKLSDKYILPLKMPLGMPGLGPSYVAQDVYTAQQIKDILKNGLKEVSHVFSSENPFVFSSPVVFGLKRPSDEYNDIMNDVDTIDIAPSEIQFVGALLKNTKGEYNWYKLQLKDGQLVASLWPANEKMLWYSFLFNQLEGKIDEALVAETDAEEDEYYEEDDDDDSGILYSGIPVFAIANGLKKLGSWLKNHVAAHKSTVETEQAAVTSENAAPKKEPTLAEIEADWNGEQKYFAEVVEWFKRRLSAKKTSALGIGFGLAAGLGLGQMLLTAGGLGNMALLAGAAPFLFRNSEFDVKAGKLNWAEITRSSMPNIDRLEWDLKTYDAKTVARARVGTSREPRVTKQFDHLMNVYGWKKKFNLIDFEYPVLLSDNLQVLPAFLQRKIKAEKENAALYHGVHSANKYSELLFIVSAANIKGVTLSQAAQHPQLLAVALQHKPITAQEWEQVVAFFNELHGAGFEYSGLAEKLRFFRTQQGKLQLGMPDFAWGGKQTDEEALRAWQKELLNAQMLQTKSENLMPSLWDLMSENSTAAAAKETFPAARAQLVSPNHFVWRLLDDSGNEIGYYKEVSPSEKERTEKIIQHLSDPAFVKEFTHLKIVTPVIKAYGLDSLPKNIQEQITQEKQNISASVSDRIRNNNIGMVLSPVTLSGVAFAEGSSKKIGDALQGLPIIRPEWAQIEGLFAKLGKEGIPHTDLMLNAFYYRLPNDTIKITLIDFELLKNGSDKMTLMSLRENLEHANMFAQRDSYFTLF